MLTESTLTWDDSGHEVRPRNHRYFSLIISGFLLAGSLVGCGRVPQVLNDEAVFGELDALYTAVTTKRTNLLDDCRQRLTKLHDDDRLSEAGFDEINSIIQMCDDEDWSDAAQRLYDFMRAQRKD